MHAARDLRAKGLGESNWQWISPLQEWLYVEECSLATAKYSLLTGALSAL
jgi:hypothetical protein